MIDINAWLKDDSYTNSLRFLYFLVGLGILTESEYTEVGYLMSIKFNHGDYFITVIILLLKK